MSKKRNPVSPIPMGHEKANPPAKKKPNNTWSKEFFYFFTTKRNLVEATLFTLISFGLYFIFLYCYPEPYTWSDSVDYVRCAINGHPGGYRPYGYSGILAFLIEMKQGTEWVLFTQFLLVWISNLYLLFTIKYFFNTGPRWLFFLFAGLIIGNEGLIYITRWLMSDSYYGAFLVIWFTSFLWLLKNPFNIFSLLIHLIALYFTVDLRYAGLILPLISGSVFLYYYRLRALPLVFGSLLVLYIIYADAIKMNKKYFGIEMFSAFSGWSLANNALAIIPYAKIDSNEFKNTQFQMVHFVVSMVPDSVYKTKDYLLNAGFMWHPKFSGKNYLNGVYLPEHPGMNYINGWVRCGPIFGRYGQQLIRNHPFLFLRYFVLLNATQIVNPYVKLGAYTEFDVIALVKEFYKLPYDKFFCKFDLYYLYLETFSLIKNVIFWVLTVVCLVVWFIKRKSIASMKYLNRILVFLTVFLVIYIGFSTVAHPIVYRYILQVHPFLVTMFFITLTLLLGRKDDERS